MKRLQGMSITIFFLIMVIYLTPSVHAVDNVLEADPTHIVTFEDPFIEKKVRTALNKPKGGLTALDLSKLTSITASDYVTSLKGLEYATNLEDIYIIYSKLSDLTPISNLKKLKSITIIFCQVQDLAPISGLTSLEILSLEGNFVSDLTPLKNLSSLKMLYLTNNNISDITPLHSLNNLERLNVDDNFVENLEGVWNLPKLFGLNLNGNLIKDLTPITAIHALKDLSFAYTQVTNMSPLQSLGLNSIHFDHTDISDITTLQNIPSLKFIYLYKNPLSEQSKSFLETFKKQTGTAVYDDRYTSAFAISKVFIDGKVHTFNTHPLIYRDSTMLPLRELFELFGADVQWDGATGTVTATHDSTQIVLTINSKKAQINHRDVTLLAEPILLKDHTLIPFRFVAEAFGYDVEWNDKNRWVMIKTVN
jgi:Leucine-rich repeat (LRR) protein